MSQLLPGSLRVELFNVPGSLRAELRLAELVISHSHHWYVWQGAPAAVVVSVTRHFQNLTSKQSIERA